MVPTSSPLLGSPRAFPGGSFYFKRCPVKKHEEWRIEAVSSEVELRREGDAVFLTVAGRTHRFTAEESVAIGKKFALFGEKAEAFFLESPDECT